jgi:methyltransferase (TIGR00027 family)
MQDNQVSKTALGTTFMRSYHATHDTPKIFDDILANQFLTEKEYSQLAQYWIQRFSQVDPAGAKSCSNPDEALRKVLQRWTGTSIVLSRAKYTEEILEKAVNHGIRQYVILGAGMDTFAFRRSDILKHLQVFEIDHPATQAFKRNRLAELGWSLPEQLHFIPLDFTKEDLASALSRSTYDPEALTFFSWLGVTPYLPCQTIFDTLHTIARISSRGSMVVFDYLDIDAYNPQKQSDYIKSLIASLKERGEPVMTGFDPDRLGEDLAKLGWHIQEDLSPSAIQDRYFKERTDGYAAMEFGRLAQAVNRIEE